MARISYITFFDIRISIQTAVCLDQIGSNLKTRTKVVHKNVSQGCNLIKRSKIFKVTRLKVASCNLEDHTLYCEQG